jgi:hypothetical protein
LHEDYQLLRQSLCKLASFQQRGSKSSCVQKT